MGVQVVLVFLLMFAGTVEAKEGGVTFWGETVTLTCPGLGNWFDKDNKKLNATLTDTDTSTYEYQYTSKGKGIYSCVYQETEPSKSIRYQFYVEGKACKGCFELDVIILAVAMILDLTFTSVLMIVIYRCTKKKNLAAPSHSAPKAPAHPGSRPPPVPSVDYEPLNLNTRSQDTYSMVNRTG